MHSDQILIPSQMCNESKFLAAHACFEYLNINGLQVKESLIWNVGIVEFEFILCGQQLVVTALSMIAHVLFISLVVTFYIHLSS